MNNTLTNKTILITKTREEADEPFRKVKEAGAKLIFFPTIKIISRIEEDAVKEKLSRSFEYDYLILTSGNAAEIFHKAIVEYKLDLSHCKVAAIGKSTAEKCRGLGIYIHIIPQEFSAIGLKRKFSDFDLIGKRILIPGSSISREDLKLNLSELGADVTVLPVYDVIENEPYNLDETFNKVKDRKPDIFVFTSPSSFQNYLSIMKIDNIESYFENSTICSIGTTTEKAIRDKNLVVNIVPYVFSLEGIADAINKFFNETSNTV